MSKRILAALVAMLILPVLITDADARPRKKRHHNSDYSYSDSYNEDSSDDGNYAGIEYRPRKHSSRRKVARRRYRDDERMSLGYSNYSSGSSESYSGVGPRPSKWCGWWMRTQRGGGPAYNVAWNWRNYGSAASPQVGAVVVWRHHVGQIVGQTSDGRWLVQSGNDGGAVRTRPRSISGAVIRM